MVSIARNVVTSSSHLFARTWRSRLSTSSVSNKKKSEIGLFWARNHKFEPYPTLQDEIETEICVIGLGGSGLSCVLELLKQGKKVVGVDAGVIAGGAAGRNGGFLLAGAASFYHDAINQFSEDTATKLYQMTCNEIDSMIEQTPTAIKRAGSLRLATTADEVTDCKEHYHALKEHNFAADWYDHRFGKGIMIPNDCSFSPMKRCHLLAQMAIKQGARLFEQSKVTSTGITGNYVTTFSGGIKCSKVIVAVDGNLELLLPELQSRVQTARFQMLATAPCENMNFPCPIYSRYGYDYCQQLQDGSVIIGGGRDKALASEWTNDDQPTTVIQRHLEQVLRESYHVKAPIVQRWGANVSFNPTGLPIIEEVRPNVWVVGSYCGTGNVLGSLAGKSVAAKVCGMPSEFYDVIYQSQSQVRS